MLCVPTQLVFAYYSGMFVDGGQTFILLLRKTAVAKLTEMLLVCFVCVAEIGVLDLFLPIRFCALRHIGCLRANKVILVPLPLEMKARILVRDLLIMISDCEQDPVVALLAYAQINKID